MSFPHLAAIADPSILKGRRFGNVILLASPNPLPFESICRAIRRCRRLPPRSSPDALEESARRLRSRRADVGWPPETVDSL